MSRRCNTASIRWSTPRSARFETWKTGEPLTCKITGLRDRPDTAAAYEQPWEIYWNARDLAFQTDNKFGVATTLETAASQGESRHYDWMDEVDGGGERFESKGYSGRKGTPLLSLFFVADGVSYRALSKNPTLLKATFGGAPTSMAADMSLMIIGRPGEPEPISEAEIGSTADTESPPIARKPEPVFEQTALIMKGGWTLTTGEAQRRIKHALQSHSPQVSPQQPVTLAIFSTVLTEPWNEVFEKWEKKETYVHLTRTPDRLPRTARSAQPVPSSHTSPDGDGEGLFVDL